MSNDEKLKLERDQRETQARSYLIRARLMAEELGAVVVAQNFRTGVAILRFAPETLQRYELPTIGGVG